MTFFLWKPYTYCLIASKPAEHFTDLGQIRRQTVDPTVYAHMPNYIRIGLLCHLSGTKKRNVGQILIFRADIPSPFLPIRAKIWCARADPRSTLTGQMSSECVHCVGFQWAKPTIFGKFWYFWELLYRLPFIYEGQIWFARADPRYTFSCQISSRSVYSVALWRRKTQSFAVFGLRHFVTSPVGGSLRMLNTGAQLQTFPYPKVSKSFLYSSVFMAES